MTSAERNRALYVSIVEEGRSSIIGPPILSGVALATSNFAGEII